MLVSLMTVNNEVGSIQPINELASATRKEGVFFHTDATQAAAYIQTSIKNIDAISLSAHKIYGPKGIGGAGLHLWSAQASFAHTPWWRPRARAASWNAKRASHRWIRLRSMDGAQRWPLPYEIAGLRIAFEGALRAGYKEVS